ncbi:DUF3558 family protein [Pseudonocardia sp. ICBG1293]|uniref:DUF3558 family protein n=1 Tax=Pseudonocardia sp. ICBG1293 TaxID=2844382 RepID=UPI001CC8EE3F|nr:DUF3558 family protein [Pseudonocardia sp. ICBG1293]
MLGPVSRRAAVVAALIGFALPLAGCGSPPGSGSPTTTALFPPRPVTVDVSGLHPCDLVDGTRRAEFGLDAGRPGEVTIDGKRSPTCTYLGRTPKIDSSVQFLPIPATDLARAPGTELGSLGGYGVVRSLDSSVSLPGCDIIVDIADDTSLRTQSQALPANLRSADSNDDVLCDRSRDLANAVLEELADH